MFRLPYPGGALELGRATAVMGILNVTPDSFSDGGKFDRADAAVEHALTMVRDGADIVDIGGESTRPGAQPVDADEELRRVIPVIAALRRASDVAISIDTAKADVAAAAVRAGAQIINDVTGLRGDDRMASTAAELGAAVVLMHMKGTPRTMQANPEYGDVVAEIKQFLTESVAIAERAGVARERIIVDPGIGFGKRPEHNIEILRRLAEFRTLECPILVGPSRKSFIGHYLEREVDDRLMGTAAAVAAAVLNGASVVRVHDVRAMRDVVRICDAIRGGP